MHLTTSDYKSGLRVGAVILGSPVASVLQFRWLVLNILPQMPQNISVLLSINSLTLGINV